MMGVKGMDAVVQPQRSDQGTRSQDVVQAGIARFHQQFPQMAARTIIPVELITCMETMVDRALEGRDLMGGARRKS